MPPDLVARMRQKLIDRRKDLLALQDISTESRATVELDQTSVGRVSRIDAMQAQQMALAAGRMREAELQRIDAALHRIETGHYGECLTCGEDIAQRRLEADPSVTRCIACARGAGR